MTLVSDSLVMIELVASCENILRSNMQSFIRRYGCSFLAENVRINPAQLPTTVPLMKQSYIQLLEESDYTMFAYPAADAFVAVFSSVPSRSSTRWCFMSIDSRLFASTKHFY